MKEEDIKIKQFIYKDKEKFAIQQATDKGTFFTMMIRIKGELKPLVYDKETDAKKMVSLLKKL